MARHHFGCMTRMAHFKYGAHTLLKYSLKMSTRKIKMGLQAVKNVRSPRALQRKVPEAVTKTCGKLTSSLSSSGYHLLMKNFTEQNIWAKFCKPLITKAASSASQDSIRLRSTQAKYFSWCERSTSTQRNWRTFGAHRRTLSVGRCRVQTLGKYTST